MTIAPKAAAGTGAARSTARLALALVLVLTASGCAGAARSRPGRGLVDESSDPEAPYLVVLGTAQDGGLPQIGCTGPECERARRDPGFHRRVASLAIVDPRSGRRWLVDATPDLPAQIELLRTHPPTRTAPPGRPPLVDGIFITHAHVGHYAGLLHLGREAYGSPTTPLYGTRRLCDFLERNGPWSLLVQARHLELRPFEPGTRVELAPDLSVEALVVPHRDEFSDTVAFLVRGPSQRVLYLPDIDKWERWDRRIEEVLTEVDFALVDGTFYADGEIPGRAMRDIPHPFIVETLARLAPLPASERAKVVFTHLNHTNPATDPDSHAATAIRGVGATVATDGMIIPLATRPLRN